MTFIQKTYDFFSNPGRIILLLSFLISSSLSYAQTDTSLFVVADYMKVAPEHNVDYLSIEQNIWKPMHAERIQRGIIVGWYLYAVEFAGTGNEYNYVVINVYDNAQRLENPWDVDILEKIHPRLSLEEILQRTQRNRETVRSELHFSIATAPAIPLETPAPYMQVNFMQVAPQKQTEYEQLESEIWLPIHYQSIQLGRTTGWGLWKSLFPRGAGRDYQYLTLNTFSDFSTILQLNFSESFNDIHPGKDYNRFLEKTQEARTIKSSELWVLIDYAIR